MKTIINNLILCTLSLFSFNTWAQQSSMELSCRMKAKEMAAQTYNSCITDARATQIEKIRKDYQKQLTELKAKYDRELKKLKGSGSPNNSGPISASTGSKPKATKGIAKTLPTRKEVSSPTAPVASTTPGSEAEAPPQEALQEVPQNDAPSDFKMELTPVPPSNDAGSTTSGEVY